MPWTDQPTEVADATLIGSFMIETHKSDMTATVEVYKKQMGDQPFCWYVTIGTLFGSKTIKCKFAHIILEILCLIGDEKFVMPQGAELLTKGGDA